MLSWAMRRRAALAFIFVTVFLDMLALGLISPVLAPLVVTFLGGDTARAAEIYGLAFTLFAAMQFVASPVLGALSDHLGRRPIVLLSNLGLGLDYVLMALAPNVGWLLVGRVLSGLTSASVTAAGAYVADVTPERERAAGFAILGAAFGLGFVLGPALGGLLGAFGPRVPFWVAAALSLLNASYGLLVLPESLPPERRAPMVWRRANPVGALAILRGRPALRGLATMMLLRHVSLRLGRAHDGPGTRRRRCGLARRPGRARRAVRAAIRRDACAALGPRVRRCRVRRLWVGADRGAVLHRHRTAVAVGT